jgi:hypothetical protein
MPEMQRANERREEYFLLKNFWISMHEDAAMEFLDISLTKDSSLLFHSIHSLIYRRILKQTILYSGFKNTCIKFAKQYYSSLFMKCIL